MINTINVSLPTKLKEEADLLVSGGHYASFSDLVRTALRQVIVDRKYKVMIEEAKKEMSLNKNKILEGQKDIDAFISDTLR